MLERLSHWPELQIPTGSRPQVDARPGRSGGALPGGAGACTSDGRGAGWGCLGAAHGRRRRSCGLMDSELLYQATELLEAGTFAFLRDLDQAIKPERGTPLLPSRVLVLGGLCLGNQLGPKTITHLAKMMARATQGELQMLYGVPAGPGHRQGADLEPPSEWQLYRLGAALLEGRVLGILKAPAPREELPRAEPRQMPEE